MRLPAMYTVRQRLDQPAIDDLETAVHREIDRLGLGELRPGTTVGVSGGSRGITNMAEVTRLVIGRLKMMGAKPFIFPAMGSHGGATADGQIAVLARYGITEETMGVPIRATMEVEEVGRSPWGLPILVGKDAMEADALVFINRVKPHTNFDAEIESGILKMMTIGACKHRGAVQAHRAAVDSSMGAMILELGRYLVKRLPILFAVGLVENARHQTAIVRAMRPERIEETERHLLKEAKALMAKIPFDFLHLLIVDEMGKDISGTGLDTNVIGRLYIAPEKEPEKPRYVRILVRDLTEKTAGNAVGIGLADFATRRLADKINFKYTYTNSLTSGTVMRSKLPLILETDHEAIEAALGTIGLTEPHEAMVVRIKNTLELEEFQASEALLEAVRANPDLEVTGGPDPLAFSPAGGLLG
jgi:hypothetical protein